MSNTIGDSLTTYSPTTTIPTLEELESRARSMDGAQRDLLDIDHQDDSLNPISGSNLRKLVFDYTLAWYVEGKTRAYICEQFASRWGYHPRNGDRYIQKAKEWLEKTATPHKGSIKSTIRIQLNKIIQLATASGDYRAAVAAIDSLKDMYGLDAPKQSSIGAMMENAQEAIEVDLPSADTVTALPAPK